MGVFDGSTVTAAAAAAAGQESEVKVPFRRPGFRPRLRNSARPRLCLLRAHGSRRRGLEMSRGSRSGRDSEKPPHTAPVRGPALVVAAGLDSSQPGTALLRPERQSSCAEQEARRAQRHLSGQLLSSSPERAARRIAWTLWPPELAICGVGPAQDGTERERRAARQSPQTERAERGELS